MERFVGHQLLSGVDTSALPASVLQVVAFEVASVCWGLPRQGMGVNGGEPLGFDVGAQGAGGTLRGLDLVLLLLCMPCSSRGGFGWCTLHC